MSEKKWIIKWAQRGNNLNKGKGSLRMDEETAKKECDRLNKQSPELRHWMSEKP